MERWITARLYVADERTRLSQYVLLGVGGVRALRALGFEPVGDPPQRGPRGAGAARARRRGCARRRAAGDRARVGSQRTVFTTHTPVPAGNDTYTAAEVEARGRPADGRARRAPSAEVIALGRTNPDDAGQPFGVTQAALRLSRAANAVSRRHGEVAREMWHSLWPDRPRRRGADRTRHQRRPLPDLGRARRCASCWTATSAPTGCTAPPTREMWAAVDGISDRGAVGRPRAPARRARVVRAPSAALADRLARGDSREYVEAAARGFDPARADDRLRPTRGDLQAARAADARSRLDAVAAGRRASGAGRAGRQGASPRRGGQALAAGAVRAQARADHRRARGVPGRLRPGHRRPARRAAATCG